MTPTLTYDQALEAAKGGCILQSTGYAFLRFNRGKWQFRGLGQWQNVADGEPSLYGSLRERTGFAIFHDPNECDYPIEEKHEGKTCSDMSGYVNNPDINRVCENCHYWSQAQNSKMGLCYSFASTRTHTVGLDSCSCFKLKR